MTKLHRHSPFLANAPITMCPPLARCDSRLPVAQLGATVLLGDALQCFSHPIEFTMARLVPLPCLYQDLGITMLC